MTNFEFHDPPTFLVWSSEDGDLYGMTCESKTEAEEKAKELGEDTRYVLIVQKYLYGGILSAEHEYHT